MVTRLTFVILAIAVALLGSAFALAKEPTSTVSSTTALQDYVDAADASYGWTTAPRRQIRTGRLRRAHPHLANLAGPRWQHQLFIYRPSNVTPTATALLLINGGDWQDVARRAAAKGDDSLPSEALVIAQIAEAIQAPVAIVCQVPEQPLFDGMHEDEIISYTFEEFCKTGDCDWPLLLPMVKSAVRAMDAVEEFTAEEWNLEIDKFLVTGASKRGWTTWLTAAVDPRVDAIAPHGDQHAQHGAPHGAPERNRSAASPTKSATTPIAASTKCSKRSAASSCVRSSIPTATGGKSRSPS